MPRKTAIALGWQMPPPATMTRAAVVDYLGSKTIYEDVLEAGWLKPCGRKDARRAASGRGRGDTLLFATAEVIAASERMAREGYPPVAARKQEGRLA
ncbi:MAG: hypothetical protein JNJ83_11095 [Verrucomicrobiaceae bacterium]|nr:hypothetical protein [Verrucomicrobiaceae bacterium]